MQPSADPNPITDNVDIRLHWLTLRFTHSDASLEEAFKKAYFYNNLSHLRHCHFYTIFFFTLAGVIDYVFFPQNILALFSVRFLIVVPIFIVGYLFSFSSYYKNCWQQISFFYILLTGGGFISFTMIAQAPNSHDYWVGIFFCMMFGYTFIRERFAYASIAGLMLILGYLFISAVIVRMPAHTLFQSNFYLFSANLLGMLIARHLEISARRDFYLEYKLSEEKRNVTELNNELEQRVQERTLELEKSNQMLSGKIDALRKSESERNKLEAQLRQAYKMEAIGTLAGGIAHDFNNILTSVLGYTELVLDEVEPGSETEEKLQEVYIAGNRAKELVRQILTFARQSEEEPRPVQVSSIVKEVVKLLRSSIPANIEIQSDIRSESFVMGDPINIHQILMNLATNASHAMEDGGILDIRTRDTEISAEDSEAIKGVEPGCFLKLTVSDNGTGIPPDILESIFEPYFTTKQGGEGTGMGLAMVYGIVKKYNGDITVESEPGRGSRFTIYLPTTKRREKGEFYQSGELPAGNERILFVDDELPIAKMGSFILERLGYDVALRTSSIEALALFQSRPDDFDLVITDTMMPNMTGDKLAAEFLKIRPDIPIILCTGYSKKISDETAKEIGIKAFTYKPIVKTDLANTVRKVLDAARA